MPSPITTITGYATLNLIPKPREHDAAGLLTAQTVKNKVNDNIDVLIKLSANTIGYRLIFFYPNTTNGCWYLHPDDEEEDTSIAFATNKGRNYSRYLISSALSGCHFGLWLTNGNAVDIAEAYLIPCRRGGGLK